MIKNYFYLSYILLFVIITLLNKRSDKYKPQKKDWIDSIILGNGLTATIYLIIYIILDMGLPKFHIYVAIYPSIVTIINIIIAILDGKKVAKKTPKINNENL